MSAVTITCVCVTRGRLALLRQAIDAFAAQTWPHKELLIVCDAGGDIAEALVAEVEGLGRRDLRLLLLPPAGATLGQLRNLAFDAARGEVFCQWDDDDLSHSDRLEVQWQALAATSADACCFTDQLQLFGETNELYWNDWRRAARAEAWSAIPGTLMLRASAWAGGGLRYPETGDRARRGEDSDLLARLEGSVHRLSGQGHLQLYRFHGANTFDHHHHRGLLRGALRAGELREREALLRAALAAYPLGGPLHVRGLDGPAFEVEIREVCHAA